MRAVVQRVAFASVTVDGKVTGKIGKGLMILLGVEKGDTAETAETVAAKIAKLRIFSDANGKMNLSATDVGGDMLVVSNFTLIADYSHGNRPSYFGAEAPEKAEFLYLFFSECLRKNGYRVENGIFGADMKVELLNDGPVTLVIESSVLKG